jgi:hypothetical protein
VGVANERPQRQFDYGDLISLIFADFAKRRGCFKEPRGRHVDQAQLRATTAAASSFVAFVKRSARG